MMKELKIAGALAFDMDVRWRIESVADTLEYLEEFLPHAKEQAFLRKRQQLKSSNKVMREAIEYQLKMMESDWGSIFPCYFYCSLVIIETVTDRL